MYQNMKRKRKWIKCYLDAFFWLVTASLVDDSIYHSCYIFFHLGAGVLRPRPEVMGHLLHPQSCLRQGGVMEEGSKRLGQVPAGLTHRVHRSQTLFAVRLQVFKIGCEGVGGKGSVELWAALAMVPHRHSHFGIVQVCRQQQNGRLRTNHQDDP